MFQAAFYTKGKVGCGYGKLDEIVGYDPLEALEAAGAIASFTGHLRNTALEMQGYFEGHRGAQTVHR